MKRCTAALSKRSLVQQYYARRWNSHDKASLTEEALLQKLESGLGTDAQGNPLRIDPETKTISTDAGSLPISPVLDPAWMKTRRRQRKDPPQAPVGRFRRKLRNNPFAQALATPVRECKTTGTSLPRYFLQDLEIIHHPTTGKPWFAPGPLAFENVVPVPRNKTKGNEEEGHERETAAIADEARPSEDELPEEAPRVDYVSAEAPRAVEEMTHDDEKLLHTSRRPRRAPVSTYTLSNESLLDTLAEEPMQVSKFVLGSRAASTSAANDARQGVFRQDMGGTILRMMRRTATDALVARVAVPPRDEDLSFVEPVSGWEAVKDVPGRGCVLWLPRDGDPTASAPRPYATLDVPGASYDQKMAVHNLRWLLGEAEVARLRSEAAGVFGGDHEVLVLRSLGYHDVRNLQLLLWRLHGYLAGDSIHSIR